MVSDEEMGQEMTAVCQELDVLLSSPFDVIQNDDNLFVQQTSNECEVILVPSQGYTLNKKTNEIVTQLKNIETIVRELTDEDILNETSITLNALHHLLSSAMAPENELQALRDKKYKTLKQNSSKYSGPKMVPLNYRKGSKKHSVKERGDPTGLSEITKEILSQQREVFNHEANFFRWKKSGSQFHAEKINRAQCKYCIHVNFKIVDK